ncbi:MAG: cobalamin biosynthesis protein [Candidatus Omnitrophica bacterium CG11_big_fil_rev_8_21_14_0_20_43_6]|nr:MAG: cobalamin biosynthesis protein [Candidatus Omnitrophica bacterium CG11_big_fil_rev_8_21_14_0_20_43_6]
MSRVNKFWMGVVVLIILSPLGLLLPQHFKAGSAWGEWGITEVEKLVGYLPGGLEKLSGFWNAPLADYVLKGREGKPVLNPSFAYILSAVIGVLVCVGIVLVLGKFLSKK